MSTDTVDESHHSLAIEQEGGVVICEAPLYPERSEAIIGWATEEFPGKPITHIVSTHHHVDHSAGLRTFVAAGATVVLHEDAEAYFRDEVFAAASTLTPDSLAEDPVDAVFEAVASDSTVKLTDASNSVTVVPITNSHAADMVMVHIDGSTTLLFQSDLYFPGGGGATFDPIYSGELLEGINASGLTVDLLVGGHGADAPLSELENYVGGR